MSSLVTTSIIHCVSLQKSEQASTSALLDMPTLLPRQEKANICLYGLSNSLNFVAIVFSPDLSYNYLSFSTEQEAHIFVFAKSGGILY